MVPATTTTTEGTSTTDAANGTPTGAATGAATAATAAAAAAATIPQASNNTPHGNTPHNGTLHGSNTPHGKTPNGSTLVTPRARLQPTRDANGTTPEEGFISAQIAHLRQQLELANKTIAHNRYIMNKYDIAQDHDIDFIEKAFKDVDPGNNNNNNNNNTTSTGTGTGSSLTTTAAFNGTGHSLTISTGIGIGIGIGNPDTNTNPYSKRHSGTNGTGAHNSTTNPSNSIDLTDEEANQKPKAKPPTTLSKVIEPYSKALKEVIHEFKSTMQAATNHLAAKQASLDKFSVPDYVVKSARMGFSLHQHQEISPLLQENFDTLSQQVETILDKHQQELTTKVIQHLGLMVKNLNHLRVQMLLQQVCVLLLMHLAGTIHKTRSKSSLLTNCQVYGSLGVALKVHTSCS